MAPFDQSNTFSTGRVQQDSWHAFADKQPDLLKLQPELSTPLELLYLLWCLLDDNQSPNAPSAHPGRRMALYSDRRLLLISSSQDLWVFTCLGTPCAHQGRVWHHFHPHPGKDQQWMVKGPEIQLSMAGNKHEKPKTAERSSHFAHSTVQSELYSFIFWVAAAS